MQADWPAFFHFADIDHIAAFQVGMLRKAGVAEPERWPQAMMAATEQGWLVRTHNTHPSSRNNLHDQASARRHAFDINVLWHAMKIIGVWCLLHSLFVIPVCSRLESW